MEDFYSEEKKDKLGVGGEETVAQPQAPAEPKVLNADDITASGDSSLSFYGSKARATNQKTGAETWYDVDANGGLTERKDAPLSMRIAENGGISPVDSMRKFEKFNRMKGEEKAKARAGYNKIIADTLGGALDQVYRNDNFREYNGQKYRVGIVDSAALAGANAELGRFGKNTVKKIFAMQQVAQTDPNQMLGEPQFVVEFNEDGVTKSNGRRIAKMLTRSQVEDVIRKSYGATGDEARGEDVIKTLFRDRAGEIKAEREQKEAKRLAAEKVAEERRRQLESESLARAKVLNDRFGLDTERIKVLGGVSADFAKEHPDKGRWLRDMFSDPKKAEVFSRTNEQEVDADGNPVTDDKGMPVYKKLSPEEAVKKAGEFYDVASGGGAANPYMSYIDSMLGGAGTGAPEPAATATVQPAAGGEAQSTVAQNQQQAQADSVRQRLIAERERRAAEKAALQEKERQSAVPQATAQQPEPAAPTAPEQPSGTPTVEGSDNKSTATTGATSHEDELKRNGEKSNEEVRKELAGAFEIRKARNYGQDNPSNSESGASQQEDAGQAAAAKKPLSYAPAPNPRAKASKSIVTNDGRKRQRGLDMSGTGYADKVADIIDSEEQRADRRESRIATLMADAQKEYRDWQSGGRKGEFKFSNQDELNALIRARFGNKDYDADVAEIVRNRLANQWLDEVGNIDFYEGVERGVGRPPETLADIQRRVGGESGESLPDDTAVASNTNDAGSNSLRTLRRRTADETIPKLKGVSDPLKNALDKFMSSANDYVKSGRAKKDVVATMKNAYDMIRKELAKSNDSKKRMEIDEVIEPFRNMIPEMNFVPFAD